MGQLIQSDLAAVGITVNLQSLEDAEFFDQVNTGEVQAFLNDWTWDNGDPDNVMFSLFTHERAVTRLGYKNETVNEVNLEAQVTADPDARAALYAEAQKLIMDDAIMVVLGYPERAIGAQAGGAESQGLAGRVSCAAGSRRGGVTGDRVIIAAGVIG